MKNTKNKQKLSWSTLLLQPTSMIIFYIYLSRAAPKICAENGIALSFFASLIPLIMFISDKSKYPNTYEAVKSRENAMYPPVPEALLSKTPKELTFGLDSNTNKYVCTDFNNSGFHTGIIGKTGSGKTSSILLNLLLQTKHPCFVIDIKPELAKKSRHYDDPKTKIISLRDRSQWGYDVFYRLKNNPTTQEIYEVARDISHCLIQIPPTENESYWKISGQNLLTAFITYYYKNGTHSFIKIIKNILTIPIQQHIQDIVNTTEPQSVERILFSQFYKLEAGTLSSIFSELANTIIPYSVDEDFIYACETNPRKANPLDVTENDYSMFVCIEESDLQKHGAFLQLIVRNTLLEVSRRPEGSSPILLVLDELSRLLASQKIESLVECFQTCRSRGCSIVYAIQSYEGLELGLGSENHVADLITNTQYLVVLSSSSVKTSEFIIKMIGKFYQKNRSFSQGAKDSSTVSFEEKQIFYEDELMHLEDELILLTDYGFNKLTKNFYFKDKYLNEKALEIQKYNQNS